MSFIYRMDIINAYNINNQHIVNEFIRYYNFIYSLNNIESRIKYYKLQAIKKTINVIVKYKNKINSGNELKEIKGIGDKSIKRIDEIINTGILSEITNKEKHINAIHELSKIYGIGPVKANYFFSKFNISTIDDLIKNEKKGTIKLTEQMKLGIKYHKNMMDKIPHKLIDNLNDKIKHLFDDNFLIQICGSYRRKKEFSSDIDILISNKLLKSKKNSKKYLDIVVEKLKSFFIIDDLTVNYTSHYMGFGNILFDLKNKNNIVRVDIIVVPENSWYSALLHFTGSAIFNQKIRLYAKKLGYVLNEYGLFKNKKKITINSEKDIFDILLLQYINPEKR